MLCFKGMVPFIVDCKAAPTLGAKVGSTGTPTIALTAFLG